MKLKAYRSIIFTGLAILEIMCVYFFIDNILFIQQTNNVSDGVLFCICFAVLAAFIGLEIYNTIHSVKHGSNFIKVLLYDDKTLVNKSIVITSITLCAFIAVFVYFLLIRLGVQLYFSSFSRPLLNLIIGLMSLCIFDAVVILLFPALAKDDLAFKIKNKY